MENYFSWEP